MLTLLMLVLASVAFVPNAAADHCAGDTPVGGEAYRAGCHFAFVVVETAEGLPAIVIAIVNCLIDTVQGQPCQ